MSFNPNELGGARGPHLDSASSQGSQGSDDSNNGFVKLDHSDMDMGIPDDLIGAYGQQLVFINQTKTTITNNIYNILIIHKLQRATVFF